MDEEKEGETEAWARVRGKRKGVIEEQRGGWQRSGFESMVG